MMELTQSIERDLMKLSKNTINQLKHFASISPNFIFKKGVEQTTIAGSKNRAVSATFDTAFPMNFPIRNLSGFLKAVSSLDDPDVKFTKSQLTISDSNGKIYFERGKIRNLVLPSKEIKFPEADMEFDIDTAQYSSLVSSLRKHHFYYVYLKGDGKSILAVSSPTYRGEYVYEQILGKTKKKFSFKFLVSSLICPIDDYKVSISSKGIARFQSKNCDYISYAAIEIEKP